MTRSGIPMSAAVNIIHLSFASVRIFRPPCDVPNTILQLNRVIVTLPRRDSRASNRKVSRTRLALSGHGRRDLLQYRETTSRGAPPVLAASRLPKERDSCYFRKEGSEKKKGHRELSISHQIVRIGARHLGRLQGRSRLAILRPSTSAN